VPHLVDDWQSAGHTTLPPEYAEWLALFDDDRLDESRPSNGTTVAASEVSAHASSAAGSVVRSRLGHTAANNAADDVRPRIASPLEGDIYETPPGVPAEFATLPLIATRTGARWFMNRAPLSRSRWPLTPGDHHLLAVWPDGTRDSVHFTVRPMPPQAF
jgi:hypothetical protein